MLRRLSLGGDLGLAEAWIPDDFVMLLSAMVLDYIWPF